MSANAWLGIDLDGTLAEYGGWQGEAHIGAPIPAMVARVKNLLAEGYLVKIMTARVAATGRLNDDGKPDDNSFADRQRALIEAWCVQHLGVKLPVTASKDFSMIALYDDRCVQVEPNTGKLLGPELWRDR